MKLAEVIELTTGRDNVELYDNSSYISMWNDWYQGKSAAFHNYRIWNGKKYVPQTRYSLGMAKKVCEDWANLLINEKTDITLGDEASQEVLNNILRECSFWRRANEGIEKTFALGMGAFVINVTGMIRDSEGRVLPSYLPKIDIQFINATKIKPLTFEDDKVTECAFVSIDSKHTYIAAHIKNEQGFYEIHNFVCDGITEDNLTVDTDKSYVFYTNNTLPWFYILKPNVANNIDIDNPLGISVFANSIDVLKSIDLIFDSYQNEFALGKKRIFISTKTRSYNEETGDVEKTFDSNDVAFYMLPEDDDGKSYINDSTQALRINEHQLALQNQLNLLSYNCGFGTQHYRYDTGGIATATQVVSENSEMFRNKKKHEILIEDALVTLVKAIIYAANTFTTMRMDETTNIEIKFDDSIIEDKGAEKESDRLDVAMNVMSKAEFRAKWYNEDLETAQRKIDEIDSVTIDDAETYMQAENADEGAQNGTGSAEEGEAR